MSNQETMRPAIDAVRDAAQVVAVDGGRGAGADPRTVAELRIDQLVPGRYQPRQLLSEEGLEELADTIREHGVLQPLVVRALERDADQVSYEIVAGERRWRAARLAGLEHVPAIVRELDDQSTLAVALIENLQREDLNPIDQARSLSRLAEEFGLTHEQVARAVGRSRSSVSNLVRLLDLDEEVKGLLAKGRIDMGHARALLPLDAGTQVAMARKAEARGLSVRQVEKAVRNLLSAAPAAGSDSKAVIDLQTLWLERQLERELGQKLSVRPDKNGGYTLKIGFEDLGELQGLLERVRTLIGQIREAAGPRTRNPDRDYP